MKNRLGLDGSKELLTTGNEIINSFDFVGDALREACSLGNYLIPHILAENLNRSANRELHYTGQRRRFMKEFRFFMDKSEVEQNLRLKDDLATVEEFSRYRLGTSAVRVVLAVNESVWISLEMKASQLICVQVLQWYPSPTPGYGGPRVRYTMGSSQC